MDELVVATPRLLDHAAISGSYHSVCCGEHLDDDTVCTFVSYLHHQQCTWTGSPPDDMLRMRDDTLLCLSTLLLAVKKNLCAVRALLESMKDAHFGLIVSTLCYYY